MTNTHQNDDATQASSGDPQRRGPVADPYVEEQMRRLADALGGDISGAMEREVNWDGVDEQAAAFNSITKTLDASITPDRPTKDVHVAYRTTP